MTQTDTILHAGELFLAWEGGNEDDPEQFTLEVMRASVDFDVVQARDTFLAAHPVPSDKDEPFYTFDDAFKEWMIAEGLAARVNFRVLQVGRYGDTDVRLTH